MEFKNAMFYTQLYFWPDNKSSTILGFPYVDTGKVVQLYARGHYQVWVVNGHKVFSGLYQDRDYIPAQTHLVKTEDNRGTTLMWCYHGRRWKLAQNEFKRVCKELGDQEYRRKQASNS